MVGTVDTLMIKMVIYYYSTSDILDQVCFYWLSYWLIRLVPN